MSRTPEATSIGSARDWLKRLGLRWLMVYFVVYIFLGETLAGLSDLPGLQFLSWIASDMPGVGHNLQGNFWNAVVPWVGEHLFGYRIPLTPNWDSGERLFNYAQDGIMVVFSLVVAGVWTSLDRGREREQKFYEGTRILLRYTLFIVLVLYYGLPKLFPCGFFPCLEPALLMQPFGDLPPYAFMFFFFGYTHAYSILIGISEVAGGGLMLFRRTTTVGALILVAVLANVFILDVLYGVEVRIFSGNLALMALFLLVPDLRRIANVMLGYAAQALPPMYVRPKGWVVTAGIVAKILLIGLALYQIPFLVQAMNQREAFKDLPLSGYYQVADIQRRERNQVSMRDAPFWQMVAIDRSGYGDTLQVRTTTSAVKHYRLQIKQTDRTRGFFYLTRCADADFSCRFIPELQDFTPKTDSKKIVLRYALSGQGGLRLDGDVDRTKVSMELHRLSQAPFLLQRARSRFIDPDDYVWSI